ncbi:MAG: dTDP-glucose 4,6-dehydratase [Methylocystis sp.]|nr:dTDP-glucose 4,6-dehydratase [Methylocystis sp.]
MRVLMSGGSGFIGSALVLHLVEKLGRQVLNIDALTYAANPLSLARLEHDSNYRLAEGDICDFSFVNAAFNKFEPDAVIHLAAESHVDRSITGSSAFVRTNVFGTQSMLDAARLYWQGLPVSCKEKFRFLHVSTDEVYGSLGDDGAFDEASRYDPRSPYSASKAASDHLVHAWGHTYGLPTLVSNCSNNYGPRQFPEKLIPLTILNALEGKALPVYGDGLNVRDWIHVEDHVRALVEILDRGKIGETYLVGARSERTNLQVVQAICDSFDRLRPSWGPHGRLVTFVSDRPGHDRRYGIDPTKVERETGWKPRKAFELALEETIAWYMANENWWKSIRLDIYQGQRLGLLP